MKLVQLFVLLICLIGSVKVSAQSPTRLGDSIRNSYHIPELAYAVVSQNGMVEQYIGGTRKGGAVLPASLSDRFRLGSNTKTITAYMAALQVQRGNIRWDTRFFDFFPKMKSKARSEYYDLTLLDLLTFRTHLLPWTYTDSVPQRSSFSGNETEERYQFVQWCLAQPPVRLQDSICFANPAYVAAGLMLEKASHRSYASLLTELNDSLGTSYEIGQPNVQDTLQVWGHNADGVPEAPYDGYKLSWLLPAGNVNSTLPGHALFVQFLLRGWAGEPGLLQPARVRELFTARAIFSIGWSAFSDRFDRTVYQHTGNPGTFLSKVIIYPADGIALVAMANIQSPEAEDGLAALTEELARRYLHPLQKGKKKRH